MKIFGISDISYMFAVSTPKTLTNTSRSYFYGFESANILSDIRLLLSAGLLHLCCNRVFGEIGKGSLSLFNNIFKFHQLMPKTREILNDRAKTVLPSTTVVRNATISAKSLQRQLSKLQKEVSDLHNAYEQTRREKFYYLFYISEMCSAYLPYYKKKNPIDSQDWEKLYNQSANLKNIL